MLVLHLTKVKTKISQVLTVMTDILIKCVIAYLNCRDPFILSVLMWRPEGFIKQNGELLSVAIYCSCREHCPKTERCHFFSPCVSRRLLHKVDEIQH